MKRKLLPLALLAVIGCAPSDHLKQAFVSPPNEARPHTWWHWVCGNVSREGITADLEAMKRVGLGGAQCFTVNPTRQVPIPAGPVRYMSPEWRALTKHAIAEAGRLGLDFGIHDCEGWNESGGPWITPDLSMQQVVWTDAQVQGGQKIAITLARPRIVENYYADIAIVAYPTPSNGTRIADLNPRSAIGRRVLPQDLDSKKVPPAAVTNRAKIIDLTRLVDSSGHLSWDAPAGKWTITRIGHTSTGRKNHPVMPETEGLECDKMSRQAVTANFNGMLAKILQDSPGQAGRGFKMVLIDSWEVGCQNWTPEFREEFQRRRGYDPMPWMLTITGRYVDSPEITDRFLWDYRRTVADLIAEHYYGQMQRLCHEHGLKFTSEAPGINMPVVADEFQCKRYTDVPMGEFWVARKDNLMDTKAAACAAHVFGANIAAAESFTAYPELASWTNDPYSLKAQGDLEFCNGINRFVFHRSAHEPWLDRVPGMTVGWWGINFERTNTWWEPGRAWIEYITRCQSMLQRGHFVADIAYFYGEDAPRSLASIRPEPPAGFDYDGINAEALQQLEVKNGRLVLPSGMSYRVLVLRATDRMTPELAQKIEQLAAAGAQIIGPKPTRSPSLRGYPDCDAQVRRAASNWLVSAVDGDKPNAINHAIGSILTEGPDFVAAGDNHDVRFIHRRDGDADIYFVSNQKYQGDVVNCTFRVGGKAPELWHPESGTTEHALVYTATADHVTMPIRFDPAGSVFVVFRSAAKTSPIRAITRDGRSIFECELNPYPQIEITHAIYGVLDDPKRRVDITLNLRARMPTPWTPLSVQRSLSVKEAPRDIPNQLRVTYSLDGVSQTKVWSDGEILQLASEPPFLPATAEVRDGQFTVWQPGRFQITMDSGEIREARVTAIPGPIHLDGPWDISFQRGRGGPPMITLDHLESWTRNADDGVKYFSGTATYTKQVDVPAGVLARDTRVLLDLGQVKNLAELSMNGKPVAILWKAPFSADVTQVLRVGTNQLEIKVTNLWPNRLIGDQKLPPDKRITWTTFNPYTANSPLLDSGLLGPVVLRIGRVVPIDQSRPTSRAPVSSSPAEREDSTMDPKEPNTTEPTARMVPQHANLSSPAGITRTGW